MKTSMIKLDEEKAVNHLVRIGQDTTNPAVAVNCAEALIMMSDPKRENQILKTLESIERKKLDYSRLEPEVPIFEDMIKQYRRKTAKK